MRETQQTSETYMYYVAITSTLQPPATSRVILRDRFGLGWAAMGDLADSGSRETVESLS